MNGWLLAAGTASAAAAAAHLLCIAGGASWYRALGAGARMTRAVAAGRVAPHLLTLCIAAILTLWAAYAWSGAGALPPLPLLGPALVAITVVYLLRAAALPVMFRMMPDRSPGFLTRSSLIVLLIGGLHAVGLVEGLPS